MFMEEITEKYYTLPCVVSLSRSLENKKPERVWVFRRAYLNLLDSYWIYAVAQVRQIQEYINRPDELFDLQDDTNDLQEKWVASSISAYSLMRICISACKVLTENALQSGTSDESIKELQEFRNKFSKTVQEIVNTRNALGAHPEKAGEIYTGSRFSSSHDERIQFSSIDLYSFKLNRKEKELHPSKHILELRSYICELVEHLRKCWGV